MSRVRDDDDEGRERRGEKGTRKEKMSWESTIGRGLPELPTWTSQDGGKSSVSWIVMRMVLRG